MFDFNKEADIILQFQTGTIANSLFADNIILRDRHAEEDLDLLRLAQRTTIPQGIALRRMVPPNARTNQGTTPSDRRRRSSAPAVIRKRFWGIPAECQVVHLGVLIGNQKFQTKTNWVVRTNGNLVQVGLF
uniref:uncharacterized protein LOC117164128 n=1 Tax=Bombus vancouverensis nearcticus TaxID=2705178 RepID=UPI00143B9475|nr:uncharacterized protein LOC117164128 [Bombus vancouverensis nearcticus]